MSSETTTLRVVYGDVTNLTIATDSTTVAVSNAGSDSTILLAAPATLTFPGYAFSNAVPQDVSRTGNAGVSNLAARADHAHSAANLLLDGGNY